LIKFHRIAPFWDHQHWSNVFARPIKENRAIGYTMMQVRAPTLRSHLHVGQRR